MSVHETNMLQHWSYVLWYLNFHAHSVDISYTICINEVYNKWSSSCSNVTVTNWLFCRSKTKSSRKSKMSVLFMCMLYRGLLSINVIIINNNTKFHYTHNFTLGNSLTAVNHRCSHSPNPLSVNIEMHTLEGM